jgi:hypothetical protein
MTTSKTTDNITVLSELMSKEQEAMTNPVLEHWKVEINFDDYPDPHWIIESKIHGIRMRADSTPDMFTALASMIKVVEAKYDALIWLEEHHRSSQTNDDAA